MDNQPAMTTMSIYPIRWIIIIIRKKAAQPLLLQLYALYKSLHN